jgi:predicted TPR repeat methyltransferase
MKTNIFSKIKHSFNFCYFGIINAPGKIKRQFDQIKNDVRSLKNKLSDIVNSNIELGIYHLGQGNYRDAAFRFKLVEKYLDPKNKKANYWLGWLYFIKSDYKNAIVSLNKAGDEDTAGLLNFIKSIDDVQTVPAAIQALYRDINAHKFAEIFSSGMENLIQTMILELNKVASDIPPEYQILELGSNIGLLGYEVNKRMQEKFHFTSTEISDKLIELQSIFYPDKKIYNEVIKISIDEYLDKTRKKYNIIFSVDDFSFTRNLNPIFNDIFKTLNNKGYLVFALPQSKSNIFSGKLLDLSYNHADILDRLQKSGLKLISCKEFNLETQCIYTIFVCTK